MQGSRQAILFSKCLGFNDARALSSFKANPRSGATELTDCLNLTTTPDGCLEKIAPLVPVLTHTAPVTRISAGSRFMFSDGVDTREWLGGTDVVNRFPAVAGPIAHTPLDVRVSDGTRVYKSKSSPAGAMTEALAGVYDGPPVTTPFYGMAPFDQAIIYNAKLYAINHADPRFIGYSEDFFYDLWNRGDGHIGHISPVLQSGAIPGCILALLSGGVVVYVGGSPGPDMGKKHYPCAVMPGTLYSGQITMSGAINNDGTSHVAVTYLHIFLCSDGVCVVDASGTLTNLTDSRTGNLGALNSTYSCATVQGNKYLAFGDQCCIEYDFQTKAVMIRDTFSVVGAAIWKGVAYFASGSSISTLGDEIDTGSSFAASLTLPLSDMGASGTKSIEYLYFTGQIDGDVIITATDNVGKSWEKDVSDLGQVTNYPIKTPKGKLGNHISWRIDCASGAFRLEELRAVFAASQRSR